MKARSARTAETPRQGLETDQYRIWYQAVKAILRILDLVDQTVEANPPVDNEKSRFGNPAFRSFYDEVQQVSILG